MPWYYAGPEAKPVGPVSLEELHARRVNGTVSPETYIIEQPVQPGETWKRYRDVFPTSPSLPPPAPAQPAAPPHPLFPSAAYASSTLHPAFASAARPDPYYKAKPTNGWCGWGFGLGLAGFFLSFACGLGLFLAIPSLFLCGVGWIQVQHKRDQAGRGLAIAGMQFRSSKRTK